jgi:uncharacterized membrane protein (UPF0127 family)
MLRNLHVISLGASVLAAAGIIACRKEAAVDDADRYAHVIAFDSTTIPLTSARGTTALHVELATSEAQQRMGLMERRHLAPDAGMLFVFDSTQPPEAGFWMYRTRIPLDIAYIDSAGVVRATRAMAPCTAELIEGCPAYSPGVPYRYALEVNGGYFTRHGIANGARISFPRVKK